MKSVLGYGLIAGFIVAFGALWLTTGDVTGAFLSLIVLTLAGALFSAVAAYFITNVPHWLRRLRGVTWSDHLEQLENAGEAEREHYETHRALTFEDLSTGCLVHLIDVGDGRLLCLYGQNYLDFEPIDDDPEMNQPRRFPTKTFALLRRKKNGEVLTVLPGSVVVDPIVCEPITSQARLHDLGIKLRDGDLISAVLFHSVEDAMRTKAFSK
jgi:hypothetical protein